MAKRFAGLKSFGSKAVSVLASGALALSLTPAIALAAPADLTVQSTNLSVQHYEPNNSNGKAIIGKNGDPLNGEVKLVSSGNNTYKYMGYVHTDGTHYHAYSLYTEIKTDSNGIVTAIDLTSGNDTFAGKWGYAKGKNADPVEGFLPDGVNFVLNENEDGDAVTYVPTLTGADTYGYKLSKVQLVSTSADGAKDSTGEANQKTSAWSDVDSPIDPTFEGTVDKDYYNLVKCTYMIGTDGKTRDSVTDNMTFNTYASIGQYSGLADDYIDTIPADSWVAEPTKGYETNRDRWTAIMGSVALRELVSWGASIADSSLSTGLDGEVGTIDTVSGATKTSVPFAGALSEARKAGYVKGVSPDVKLTIDGERPADSKAMPGIDVNANFKDLTSVDTNAQGQYVASVVFPYKDTIARNGQHGVTLDKVSVYALGDQTVGTQGMMTLAKQNSPEEGTEIEEVAYTPLAEYTPESLGLNPVTSSRGASYSWVPSGAANGLYVTAIDDGNVKFDYEPSEYAMQLTAKNKDITHAVFKYTLGHGKIAIAYDLANMSKVATTAETDLRYDVRPFKANIDQASAMARAASWMVTASSLTSSDANAVSAARAAYTDLDADAKAQVSTASVDKLAATEKAIDDAAKEAAAKAAAEAAAKVVNKGDVKTYASQTYQVTKVATDSAQGAVTFTKAKNASSVTVPATITLNDGKTYQVTQVAASAFTASKIRTVTIGTNVSKIAAKAFKGSKATKAVVKSTSLKKANVKNCFKGASKMKTVKVPAKKLSAYKKIFTKKITGSSKALSVKK